MLAFLAKQARSPLQWRFWTAPLGLLLLLFRHHLLCTVQLRKMRVTFIGSGIKGWRAGMLGQPVSQSFHKGTAPFPILGHENGLWCCANVPIVDQFRKGQSPSMRVDATLVPLGAGDNDPGIDGTEFGANGCAAGEGLNLFERVDRSGEHNFIQNRLLHQRRAHGCTSNDKFQKPSFNERGKNVLQHGCTLLNDRIGFIHRRSSLDEEFRQNIGRKIVVASAQNSGRSTHGVRLVRCLQFC
mmetsp:Transcript_9971/g.21779  ORF Transcript_9971/g.21779 Transcript_9971/m.21779 type:complete len:241 (-) Transcript_9971:681-1403(-)